MSFKFPKWYVTLADTALPRWAVIVGIVTFVWYILTGNIQNPAWYVFMAISGVFVLVWSLVIFVTIFYPLPPEERGMWD